MDTILTLVNELNDIVRDNTGQPASTILIWRGCADPNYYMDEYGVGQPHAQVQGPKIFALLPRRSLVRAEGGAGTVEAGATDSIKHRFNRFRTCWKGKKEADRLRMVVEPRR